MSGILAHRGAQRVLEAAGVGADLALVDQAALVLVHELDRVLDGDDVIGALAIDVVDHRAQRRRLARPGRPGDQHQSLAQAAQLEDVRRQPEVLGAQDLRRDDAEHRAAALAIEEHVGAEAGEALDLVGEVGVVALRELGAIDLRRDRLHQRHHVVVGQRRRVRFERQDVAVLANQRRHARRQVQVGRLGFDHQPEQPIDRRRAADDRRLRHVRHGSGRGCRGGCQGRSGAQRPVGGAAASRVGVWHEADHDLGSVAEDRHLERAARRGVVEIHRRFLRQPAARLFGNNRADQLQDLLPRQRMRRRFVRGAVDIENARRRAGREAHALAAALDHDLQHAVDGAQLVTSVSATMWAELINSVRSSSST